MIKLPAIGRVIHAYVKAGRGTINASATGIVVFHYPDDSIDVLIDGETRRCEKFGRSWYERRNK